MSNGIKKEGSIETLRALAIILVVAGHVIGDTSASGMRVADDGWLRHFYYSFQFVRLPLFTTISGFVYALRPVSEWSQVLPCLRGKVRRLLVPMATVATLQFLAMTGGQHTNHRVVLHDIWRIYCYGFQHYWFLQAIFLVVAVVVLFDAGGLLRDFQRWLLAIFGCCLASLYLPRVEFFSFAGFLYLLPYFVLGVGLARFAKLKAPAFVAATLLVFLACMIYQQYTWYSASTHRIERLSPTSLLIGASAMILAFRVRRSNEVLNELAYFAFPVYLFHVFGTAPSRILIKDVLHIRSAGLIFVGSLVGGLALPVLLTICIRQSRVLAMLLLGERTPRTDTATPSSRIPWPPYHSRRIGTGPR